MDLRLKDSKIWLLWLIVTALGVMVSGATWAKHHAAGKTKYISLTVGLTTEEKVPNMPNELSDDMTYNHSIVHIAVAKELKVIRFEPVASGTTNFTLRDGNGNAIEEFIIKVSRTNLAGVAAQIKSLLNDIEGINIRIINNKVVVDGEILIPSDMNRIYSVVSQFPDLATSIVRMSPMAQKKIAEKIEQDIGNPEIHCRAVNEKFILEGVASSEAEKQKAEILAKAYVPDVVVEAAESAGLVKKRKVDSVINLLVVRPGPEPQPGKIIKLIVHYVELQKDYNRSFRFQWMPSLADNSGIQFSSGGQNSGGGVLGTITGTINNLLPQLNFAKAHGHARVLQSSTLIVQDGSQGEIKSITRVPYSVQNQFGQLTTNFEDTGLDATIKPRVISPKSDSIAMDITFSLKALVGQTEQGPLISNKTIQTNITVRSTQSAAIGGLVSNNGSTAYNRLPQGVSSNPILSLYASKQFQHDQSQFVVFITPVIMNSASEGADEVKKKFRLRD